MTKKTVLITGCSSGFGKLTAKKFQAQGWNVIATMRSPEKETELGQLSNTRLLKLDVSDPQSVKDAVEAGLEAFGRIDVLVNNAGKSGYGVFEQWDESAINTMFEVNLFGMIRVTKEVLPIMRRQQEGVIVNISSVAGLVGAPLSSIYSASKFAVEGLTEALALEYAPFNISSKVIAPGAYETNLFTSIDRRLLDTGDTQVKDYSQKLLHQMEATVEQMKQRGDQASDPQEVADKIYQCATEETPIHNVCGDDAEGILKMKRTLLEGELIDTVSAMFVPAL